MPEILVEKVGPSLIATFNRPETRNALTYEMHDLIRDIVDRANADDDIRAVIFTGAGAGFCAGTDLKSGFSRLASGTPADADPADAPRDKGGEVVLHIFGCRKPMIAAVNGAAAGMGASMTLAMDYRIGSPNTRYLFPYVQRGILPESCSSWFLPRLVGISKALDWMESGRTVEADEALASGLIGALVPERRLLELAHSIVERMTRNTSSLSVSMARQLMWQGMIAPHPIDAHRHESRALVIMAQSGDPKEGAASFMEKRPPNFSGKVSAAFATPLPGWAEPPY